MLTPQELAAIEWDAVIVGTGMGGATLGYALARAGQRVLFCERGRSRRGADAAAAVVGNYPELAAGRKGAVLDAGSAALLSRAGRSADTVIDASSRRTSRFTPFIGAGDGGSSALYGMALERFTPADFEPRANYPNAGDSTLPDAWPVRHAEFERYYAAAEALYRVRGAPGSPSIDGGRPTPPLTPAAADLFEYFRGRGLHPYRLPMACEFVEGCQSCQGYLCPMPCKNDSARIGLDPALQDFGAVLLDECEAVRIEADATRATAVICRWRGESVRLRGRRIVLAAGALQTPGLLLASRSGDWPDGLANRSGLVGRNLMRHFVDLYVLPTSRPRGAPALENRFKEFAFNDFYQLAGEKLGSVQSFGRLPPAAMLFGSLLQDVRDGKVPWLARPTGLLRPVLRATLEKMVSGSMVLASIMEDLPYADNRVALAAATDAAGPRAMTIDYRLRDADRRRIARFRTLMREALQPRRWRLVKQAENNQRLAHACGTCRFGDDPASSVLDAGNRCHGIANLYVVDSSFFPSSGGTNPSLTIAANALRVAEQLIA